MKPLDVNLTAGGILFSLLLALIVYWLAQKNGFFKLPLPSSLVPVTFWQTAAAFFIYFIFAFIILPVGIVLLALFFTGDLKSIQHLPHSWLVGIQLVSLWILFVLLIFYACLIPRSARHFIFWGEGEKSAFRLLKNMAMGVLTCAISYPFVLVMAIIAKLISVWIWGEVDAEQAAIRQLKLSMENTILFILMIFTIVVLVPIMEELLFRGFFQNFLKRHFGRKWAIAISSILFAFAHFAKSQKEGNFQLILTLCVLAFFLGFIYERQRSLWAPIALHMTFNGVNVFMIILQT